MATAELVLEPPIDPWLDFVSVEHARLVRAARAELLTHAGAITVEMLTQARGTTDGATRQWIRRHRASGKLFTVEHQGRTLLPTVQFTEVFDLDPTVAEVTAKLVAFGMGGWAIWFWYYAKNTWIDRRPVDALADGDIAAMYTAADRLTQS